MSAPTLTPMPDAKRRAVRALLVAEADAVVPPTAEPARSAPALPRPRSRTRRLVLVAVPAAVAAAAGVLVVADPAAEPALANWTAVPRTAPGEPVEPGQVEAWASQCTDLTGGGVAVEGVERDRAGADGRVVLVDRRGPYTFCVDVFVGTGTAAEPFIGLAGLSGDGVQQSWTSVWDRPVQLPAADGVLLLGDGSAPPPEGEGPEARSAYGLVGRDVTGVEVLLADGTRVVATVQDGLWGAWWPATEEDDPSRTQLVVRTAAGERTVDPQTVSLPWDEVS